ncbi:MAG: NAD-glutamate dehydrogenase [Pseudomonadota bacterium]
MTRGATMAADSQTSPPLHDQILAGVQAEMKAEPVGGLAAEDLEALVQRFADWAAGHLSGKTGKPASVVRVSRGLGANDKALKRTLLEAAGPDMPFIVDSLLNACTASGLEVLNLFHPIVTGPQGEAQSAIQIHLPLLADAEAEQLAATARQVLEDVALAVSDYPSMREAMSEEIDRLRSLSHLPEDERDEAVAFLEWLAHDHFVFLGRRVYEYPSDKRGALLIEEPDMVEGSNLGLLRDEALNVLHRSNEPTVITAAVGAFLQRPTPIIVAKSTVISRVHRRVFADYVGIKHYNTKGMVNGETRFLGLFTADTYNEPAQSIPLVRHRVKRIVKQSGALPRGHTANSLSNIIETWPRDELLQADAETLAPMLLGALHLIGRPRTRVFLRWDEFDRFATAVVFVPREAYDSDLRRKISAVLERELGGSITRFEPRFDSAPVTRVLFNIALDPEHQKRGELDAEALEAEIAALARTWDDAFRTAVIEHRDVLSETAAVLGFAGGFNAAYREAFSPEEAIVDVGEMAFLGQDTPVRLRAYRNAGDGDDAVRAKIYSRTGAIPLSDCVPVFENMGLRVKFETGYPVRPQTPPAEGAPEVYWVHDLFMWSPDGGAIDLGTVAAPLQDAFAAIWNGVAENDGFNQLVISAGATWRQAALIRTLSAYRHQTGLDPARQTRIDAVNAHPDLTRLILDLFAARFDPDIADTLEDRTARCEAIREDIEHGLESVEALDDDRVIRRLADLVLAMTRTSYYHDPENGLIVIKIASREVEHLPEPKPFREIFMASPTVEAVHCRFGPVSRGGLRWSDRRDDFRTEVLGLVKAQQVKNAVIVPTGSKGGFYPKGLPAPTERDLFREMGTAAYKTFIGGMLSVTDNLVGGDIQHPERTVIWDGEDPYLVVAADKGTATFSDTANEISQSQGFWLGDAFASGGSAGYDHKKMGITARGGWEAVKRHFRELGKDIQSEPFTVIGVGDMSGDVFGNGMLLSRQIKLLAAFNHLHIFIDPDPQDTESAFNERERLFQKPRSTWDDYNRHLISKGGGVFDRSAKSVTLTPEIKALTGLAADSLTPNQLIKALLASQAELMWFGGIGTYVKAAHETHADVGDRANDLLRIDASDLNVQVIGEGANLGMTQASRVAFAQRGGHVNTDAIDNSAGVDSSDHEVNIKILTAEAIRRGDLSRGERNALLASMTIDVATHVLAHNYSQTSALSLALARADNDHNALERLMVALETRGVLNRAIEGVPDTARMAVRAEQEQPLTRPELAVLLAWSKITLFEDLVASDVPDDPAFEATLKAYFPEALRGFEAAMDAHRLRREIIATVLSNRMLDTLGPAALQRLREGTGAPNAALCRAFEIARTVLSAEEFDDSVIALDNEVPAAVQTRLRLSLAGALIRATEWFVTYRPDAPLGTIIDEVHPILDAFKAQLRGNASPFIAVRIERQARTFQDAGVPTGLAQWASAIEVFAEGLRLVPMAIESGTAIEAVSTAAFQIGDQLRIDRLIEGANTATDKIAYWDRIATRRMVDDLVDLQTRAVRDALSAGGVEAWMADRSAEKKHLLGQLKALSAGHGWSFARFALATDAIRRFMDAA